MTQLLPSSSVTQAEQILHCSHRIVIFTHMAPDGDAMGSSLAMWHFLNDRLNDVQVKVITPNAFPAFLAWMPGADKILVYEGNEAEANKLIADADLHICLDFNEPKRISAAGEHLLLNNCPKLLIDHHLMADGEWTNENSSLVFSYPSASSTCELVFRFIWQMSNGSYAMSQELASCLYTGLMTDTGNFAFNSNNPDLYEMIAELLRAGINKDEIYNAVFNQYSEERVRLMGYSIYRKMQLYPEYHLALIALSDEELQRFQFKAGDTEGIVNIPLQISDVYYSVFMREQPPKPGTSNPVIKVSFRSQGDRPVNVFAHEVFGGGGHANASGGEYYGSLGRAIRLFEKHFPQYLKKD